MSTTSTGVRRPGAVWLKLTLAVVTGRRCHPLQSPTQSLTPCRLRSLSLSDVVTDAFVSVTGTSDSDFWLVGCAWFLNLWGLFGRMMDGSYLHATMSSLPHSLRPSPAQHHNGLETLRTGATHRPLPRRAMSLPTADFSPLPELLTSVARLMLRSSGQTGATVGLIVLSYHHVQ